MARLKQKTATIAIADWKQADNLLKFVGDMQVEIEAAEAAAKAEIDVAKKKLAGEVEQRKNLIEVYVRSLEAFAAAHQEDFGDARSRKLNFGTIGWRKSTAIKIRNVKLTLEKIKEVFKTKAAQFLRIKEEIDKEALAKLSDEQLKVIDARREPTDVFYVEPSIPQAAEH